MARPAHHDGSEGAGEMQHDEKCCPRPPGKVKFQMLKAHFQGGCRQRPVTSDSEVCQLSSPPSADSSTPGGTSTNTVKVDPDTAASAADSSNSSLPVRATVQKPIPASTPMPLDRPVAYKLERGARIP